MLGPPSFRSPGVRAQLTRRKSTLPRTILGPGAHSGSAAGFDSNGTDGIYGPDSIAAVEPFQQAHAMPVTGIVDDATWQALMQTPVPAIDVPSLELTVAFEGHGYTLAMGNFDGAWLTSGIIGFTLISVSRLPPSVARHPSVNAAGRVPHP